MRFRFRRVRRFWSQPSKAYRDFQIAFTILTLNFVIPAFGYSFAPASAMESFLHVNRLLGGTAYAFPEAAGRVWRYLAAANVMTLGFMCLLLQLDLRRFHVVVVPLTFMKAYAALSWWVGWALEPGLRFFLAAALLDTVTCAAFVHFSGRAFRDIAGRPDAALVPRPMRSA